MKKGKITISDIAAALDISPVSISRALSGQSGVSEKLKDRIVEKAKEMGYIKIKKNQCLNILVLHQQTYMLDNRNFGQMAECIAKALQKANADYDVELLDKSSQTEMILPYKLSKRAAFDGVIIIGRFDPVYARFIKQKINNLIYLCGYSPAFDYDSVCFNYANAGYKQCENLIKKGHKVIGYAENNKNSSLFRNKEIRLGVSTALEDFQLLIHKDYFLDLNGYHEKLSMLTHAKTAPTAIVCDDDFTALELIKLLYENNIKVPDDISIIGCGNTEMAALAIPALTTLDLNIEYTCEVAVATLLKRILHPDKPYENIAILSKLVERDSVRSI